MEITAAVENLLRAGRLQEARDEAARLLMSYPANSHLNAYLGLCEFRLGRYEESVPPLQRAIALDPTFVDAGIKLAQAFDRLHRYHECAVVAKDFLHHRPSDHTLQGLLDAHQGELSLDREGWEKSEWVPAHRAKLTNR
jgi:tetratricopeptide (TPR) repeat protein